MRPILAGLLATMMGVGACSGSHEPGHATLSRAPAARPAQPGVDVPALLSLNIDEMTARVGPLLPVPTGFVDPTVTSQSQRSGPIDSIALFRSRGLAMVVAYDSRSREVNDLLLLGSNESDLMNRARLQLGADRYLVLPVFQERRPTQLMGLRVLPVALNQ
ncbi:hypothetical protein MUN81_08735 [Hymenobacter sp. 5317J-9]|uniref:hypothetical protein n=1 Tax=Hymenobacter sp. 5317J-9 TaxID=2932250 RepID=UPI001FD657D6|nr:hypothetical protein [Hymenobacter sp. 5317J-9]UOQ99562.1 hypothetical protein MUN81_08735 [Hymenobacter sp. 5317J-9]